VDAAQFKETRQLLGLTQTELATELRCSRRAVSYWEAGDHPIPGTVARLLEFLLAARPTPSPNAAPPESGADIFARHMR